MKSGFHCALGLAIYLCLVSASVHAAPSTNTVPRQNATHAATVVPNGQANNVEGALVAYQVALDQIAGGHLAEARVMLEENIRRNGDKPELNTLLAYLLQREGRSAEARAKLTAVAPTSPLAAAYSNELARAGNSSPRVPGATGAYTGMVSGASSKPATSLPQADARLEKMEQSLAGLVNAERAKAGLGPLSYDPQLAAVARAHSAEMRDLKYFAHESPTLALHEPLDRYRAVFNTTPAVVAENVFRAWGTQHELGNPDVQSAHTALMNSPGHRANILFPNVNRIGIGIVANATGDIWITQMFSKP
ncbi:MAG: hypothetical protein JO316_22890 [Abitibacteriaceae bacterium]|nr:hypothetical protein [Abditibacteriaceae bacterium]MBV9868211.1 hypothetical protein [Abditibacteriaceae bacterium]